MAGKSGSGGNIIGYRYFLAMLMGLCRGPIDAVTKIKANDIEIFSGNVASNGVFTIAADAAFGGDDKEGGVSGLIDMQMGAVDQDLTGSPFQLRTGGESSLRGVATMFFRGAAGSGHIGGHVTTNSPYPKAWSVRVWRALAGWFGGTAWYPDEALIVLDDGAGNLINAMNPAHIIYECLTNPVWGRGLNPVQLDETSFISAANVLCREKFGLCIAWTRTEELASFLQNVFNHIGAALYPDRSTGLLTLKLIRQDYTAGDLPIFDYTSGLLSIQDDATTAPDNSHSEIIVNWRDPVTNNARQTRVQNLAGTQANQTVTSTSVDYIGVPTSDLAARLAQRDLSLQAAGIKRFTLILDRRGRKITPAGVFRINVPDRSISNMVLRCGTIEEGPIGSQSIKVVALQDVFGLEATTYVGEPIRTWTPPDRSLNPVAELRVTEVNYVDEVRVTSVATLATIPVDSGTPVVVAKAPTPLSVQFELMTAGSGEEYADHGSFGWTPAALLGPAISMYDTSMTLTDQYLTGSLEFPTTAWIDDEIVEVTSYNPSTGVMVIGRGCIDTIPASHSNGARIWFPAFAQAADGREFTLGEATRLKLLTRTSTAVMALGDATEENWTIIARQGKPYVPGDLKIGGTRYGDVGTVIGDVVLTWAHRDRITQSDHILVHGDASTGPEASVTYTTRVYAHDGTTLVRTTTGITAATWTYTDAMAITDAPGFAATIELEAVRGGIVSFQKYRFTYTRQLTGYGNSYGLSYGLS